MGWGYRKARNELVEAEDELRTQAERVAELRRALPLGGELAEDYEFEEPGPGNRPRKVRLSQLFGSGQQSLLIYGFMFSADMEQPCPMCTSFLDSLNGAAPHLSQQMSVAVSARSPIDRISEFAARRGWANLRLLSSAHNSYQYDYLAEADDQSQLPMANVFVQAEEELGAPEVMDLAFAFALRKPRAP